MGNAQLLNVTPKPHWTVQDVGHDFEPVTKEEVRKLVKEIDIGKGSCVDGVSTCILKDGFYVTKPFTILVQCIIRGN